MSLEAAAEHVGPDGSPNGYVKLTSNELSFGPLPEAETAMREALPRLNRYPDRHAGGLREAVAERSESTRLNSSHANISYAVFCLKKKKQYYYYVYSLQLKLSAYT